MWSYESIRKQIETFSLMVPLKRLIMVQNSKNFFEERSEVALFGRKHCWRCGGVVEAVATKWHEKRLRLAVPSCHGMATANTN